MRGEAVLNLAKKQQSIGSKSLDSNTPYGFEDRINCKSKLKEKPGKGLCLPNTSEL